MAKRILIGEYPDGVTYGMRISKPTFDVTSPTISSDNLFFDSTWDDTLKLHAYGQVSLATNNAYPTAATNDDVFTTITFPALSYRPVILLMCKVDSNDWEGGSFYRFYGGAVPGPIGASNPPVYVVWNLCWVEAVSFSSARIHRLGTNAIGTNMLIRYYVIQGGNP